MKIRIKKKFKSIIICKLLICIILITSFNINIFAQTDTIEIQGVWVDLQLGSALGNQYINVMTGGVNISYTISKNIFTGIRAGYSTDDLTGKRESASGITGTIVKDIGGLLGYIGNSGNFQYTAATGLSYIYARYRREPFFEVLNLPFELSVIYTGPLLGFGITAFDYINSKITYYGMMLTFRLKVK